jgi:ribosomal protein S18 acetylase RimI-like enzyme
MIRLEIMLIKDIVVEPSVWQVSEAECGRAGAVLARAFANEQLVIACYPATKPDLDLLTRRWSASLRYARQVGQVWAIGSAQADIGGAAMVYREPLRPPSPEARVQLGYPDNPAVDAAVACMFQVTSKAYAVFEDWPSPWRHLAMLGVDPDRQGQGLGSVLLEHILADASAAGEPLGLMTTRERNVSFYRRAGLELCWSGVSDDGTIPMWSFRTPLQRE